MGCFQPNSRYANQTKEKTYGTEVVSMHLMHQRRCPEGVRKEDHDSRSTYSFKPFCPLRGTDDIAFGLTNGYVTSVISHSCEVGGVTPTSN